MIVILTLFTLGAPFVLRFRASEFRIVDFRTVPFLAEMFAAASYQLSWSIYVSDYSRYLPREVGTRESSGGLTWAPSSAAQWMMLVGTVAAASNARRISSGHEGSSQSDRAGIRRILLVGSLLGLVTISALNFYGASLTLLSVADTLKPLRCTAAKRLASVAAAVIAATALALASSADFINRFEDFLSLLLYLFTPWTAINLVDFYWYANAITRSGIFNPRGMYGRWNWRGLLAYGVGFVAMIPSSAPDFHGPAARALGGADVAMLVGPARGGAGVSVVLPLAGPRARSGPRLQRRSGAGPVIFDSRCTRSGCGQALSP